MRNRSRSALFLMEQLIVIAVFAICAAVCVKTFAVSYFMVSDSKDKNGALLAAASCAESYKAAFGDLKETADILGGTVSDGEDALAVYYDKNWRVCAEGEAVYTLKLTAGQAEEGARPLVSGDISVEKNPGGGIVSFTVTARRGRA